MAFSGTEDQDALPLHLPPAPQSVFLWLCPSATRLVSLRQNIGQFIWPASIYGLKFIVIFFLLCLNQLNLLEFVLKFLKGFSGCSSNCNLSSTAFHNNVIILFHIKRYFSNNSFWVVKKVMSTSLEFSTIKDLFLGNRNILPKERVYIFTLTPAGEYVVSSLLCDPSSFLKL